MEDARLDILAEQAHRLLEGGDIPADTRYSRRELRLYIQQCIAKLALDRANQAAQVNRADGMKQTLESPASMLVTLGPIKVATDVTGSYVVLPEQTIWLPAGRNLDAAYAVRAGAQVRDCMVVKPQDAASLRRIKNQFAAPFVWQESGRVYVDGCGPLPTALSVRIPVAQATDEGIEVEALSMCLQAFAKKNNIDFTPDQTPE